MAINIKATAWIFHAVALMFVVERKEGTKYLNMSISKAHKVVITTSPGLKDTWMRQWENVLFEVIQFVWTKTDM